MIKGLLDGETPKHVLRYTNNRLKVTDEELLDALEGEINSGHHFVMNEVMAHIEELEDRIKSFQLYLLQDLAAYSSDAAEPVNDACIG